MDEILRQLGGLVLGSVPTMIIFLVLVFAYWLLVQGPLTRMLAERRYRTLGAIERANAAIAAADAKSQEYEAKLRAARAEIFRHREQRVHQWNAERDRALARARLLAEEQVRTAQAAIHAQAAQAHLLLEDSVDQLAAQIVQAVVPVHGRGHGQAALPPQSAITEGAR